MSKTIVFVGPPGSGKGTQISELRKYLDLEVLSTGDIARGLAEKDPEIQKIMDKGELISDDLIFSAIDEKIAAADKNKSIIFDGFPRNLTQAKKLDELLLHHGRSLDATVYVYLDEDEVVTRLTIRKVCEKCGRPLFDLPKCPDCGGLPTTRKDDNKSTIINRMQVFLERTLPIVSYYETRGKLKQINGKQSIESVASDIKESLSL